MPFDRAAFWRMILVASLAVAAFAALVLNARAETMRASYYGAESGTRTASGARFDPNGRTAASRDLPFGTRLAVCFHGCVTVTVNDRGPAKWTGRGLDLSRGAARAIGLVRPGVAAVQITRLN